MHQGKRIYVRGVVIITSMTRDWYLSYPMKHSLSPVSLYHRDYREWEPVVITVEPKGITIQNVGGPDRSIPSADINRGELLISKRYRNRRLGEYLKELELTEGRSTGIPTIQNVLKANGSPRAIVVTDEERTFFRITIPCHEGAGNIIADIAKREGSPISTNEGSPIGSPISSPNTADAIIAMIKENPYISTSMMAGKLGISKRAVIKHTNQLQLDGKIKRNGSARSGSWEIIC